MRFETVKVTPKQARAWLEASEAQIQRTRARTRVDRFAHDMINGHWLLTHQPIAISPEGIVFDGQHRLAAVVAANRTVSFLVAFDADPTTFGAIDTGAARTPADTLKIEGYTNTSVKASVARLLLAYDAVKGTTDTFATAARQRVTTGDIQAVYASDRAELILAGEPVGLRAAYGLGKFGLKTWATVAWVIIAESKIGPSTRAEFFERFTDGLLLGPGSPILALRNWMTRETGLMSLPSQARSTHAVAQILKAFNRYVLGETVQVAMFKIGREVMPIVAELDHYRLERLEREAEAREAGDS